MNVLIIYCHPSQNSYTHDVFTQLTEEIQKMNWSLEVSDLYAMNFRSDMTEEEYTREAFSNTSLAIPEDVALEHEKINRANCIIFLYPVWWSDCPAKLKGWFDRVYTVGYAYKQNSKSPGMKPLNYGLVICTAGYSNQYLTEIGIAQSMEKIMLDDRLGKRFIYKEMLVLGGSIEQGMVKQLHTEEVKKVTSKIAQYCSQE